MLKNVKITIPATVSVITRLFIFCLVAMSSFAFSCKPRSTTSASQPASSATDIPSAAQPTPTTESKKYSGTGLVTKVVKENPLDKTIASVEMEHGEIVGLMPAMRMEFIVKDKSMLEGIKIGDLIDFTIVEIGPTPTIIEIKKK